MAYFKAVSDLSVLKPFFPSILFLSLIATAHLHVGQEGIGQRRRYGKKEKGRDQANRFK
jgi:hypothetical protein